MKKVIDGFSKFSVDEHGVVYGARGKPMAPHINKGRLAVKIFNDAGARIAMPVHRIVANAFVGCADGMRVRHIDGNIENNSASNLEIYDHRSSADEKIVLARVRANRYAAKNKDKARVNSARWCANNKSRKLAQTRARQAAKLHATPKWADLKAIERIYENARYLTEVTGHVHHVDHIIPLQGKTVCGLHVENNLRAIPHFLNTRKGNRLEI